MFNDKEITDGLPWNYSSGQRFCILTNIPLFFSTNFCKEICILSEVLKLNGLKYDIQSM